MKKRNRIKRVISAFLVFSFCVTSNVQPISIIADALCESEFIQDCGVLYDNLKFLASNGFSTVHAANSTGSSSSGSSSSSSGSSGSNSSGSSCNCTFTCNAPSTAEICKVLGEYNATYPNFHSLSSQLDGISGSVGGISTSVGSIATDTGAIKGDVTDIKNNVGNIATDTGTIKGDVETVKGDVETVKGDVEDILTGVSNIDKEDSNINKNLKDIFSSVKDIPGKIDTLHSDLTGEHGKLTGIDNKLNIFFQEDMPDYVERIEKKLKEANDELKDINTELDNITGELGVIGGELDGMTHDYRVAHLYSLNNEDNRALWRPSFDEVKGVVDYAYLNGGFANIYSGGWDTLKSPIDKSHELLSGVGATRALEVLGYDAILRREGFLVLGELAYCEQHSDRVYFAFNDLTDMYDADCGERLDSGQLVCPVCYKAIVESGNLEALNGLPKTTKWESVIFYEQTPIPEDDITWFDAVTVLYKALGQETITYRSFMYHNDKITPATSPAYQNLSNIDGFDSYDYEYETIRSYAYDYEYDENGNKKDKNGDGVVDQKDLMPIDSNKDDRIDESDKVIETQVVKDSNGDGIISSKDKTVVRKKVYQGYDYKVFASRSNIYTGVRKPEESNESAVKNAEAFDVYWTKALNDGFVLDENKEKPITGQNFYKLCQRMMEAYGEPVLNQDEIDALLQVYGAEYPIQLGTEVADAWAYLKARGCLEADISYTGTITRDQLLDVAMRIKDEDSRTDYKNINIVLDLDDVMISDGYYPVADLNIVKGDFSATTTFDWGKSNYYDILIPKFDITLSYTNTEGQAVSATATNFAVLTKDKVNDAEFNYSAYVKKNESEKQSYLESFGAIQNSCQAPIELDGYIYYHFKVHRPTDSSGVEKLVPDTIWIVPINTFTDVKENTDVTADRKFVKVPAKYNVGGIFNNCPDSQTYFEIKENPVFFSDTNYSSRLIGFTDCQRAGDLEFIEEGRKDLAYLPEEPTLIETIAYYWDTLTTPMVVEAANPPVTQNNNGSTMSAVTIGFNNIDNTTVDVNIKYEADESNAYNGMDSFRYLNMAEQPDSATALLNRFVTAFEYNKLKTRLLNATEESKQPIHAGQLFDNLEATLSNNVEHGNFYTYGLTEGSRSDTAFNPRTSSIQAVSKEYEKDCDEWKAFKTSNSQVNQYGINSPEVILEYNYAESQWPAKFVLGMDGMERFDFKSALNDKYQSYVQDIVNLNNSGGNGGVSESVSNSVKNVLNNTLYVDDNLVTDTNLQHTNQSPTSPYSYEDSKIFWSKALGKTISTSSINNYEQRVRVLGDLLSDLELRYKSAKEDWNAIWDMCVEYEIQNVTQEANGTIKVELKGDAESFIAAIGEELSQTTGYTDEFMGKDVSTLLDTSIRTSAIMSRKENVLIAWDDLIAAGFVIDTFDGRNPEKDPTGTYNIQTVYGLVKVNPGAHTILIGNTFYNLDDNGTGPNLVYIHLDEKTNEDTFYLDYRCIMGLCSDNLREDKEMTTAIKAEDSLGVGNSVVYSICAGEVDTKLFTTKEFNTYLYPDVDKFSNTTTGLRSYYRTNLVLGTMYDGEKIVNNNVANGADGHEFLYWDKTVVGDKKRMTMSTFNPTANWLVSVRQTDSYTGAYLYVWYPRKPFMAGFEDFGSQGETKSISIPKDKNGVEIDFKSLAEDAVSKCYVFDGKSFNSVWDSVYGSTPLEWFDYMTKYSAACLFNETNGGYYLDDSYVCRRFDISDSTAVKPVNEYRTGDFTSNDSGALYWLEGIGYVYNIPSISEFTMKDYFEGKYPLPVAMDDVGKYGSLSIVNFNLDYYGRFKVDNNDVVSNYGWVLSSSGVVDLDGNTKYSKENLEGYWTDQSALDALKTDTEKYPFVLGDGGDYVMAPAGIYSVITGLAEESITTKGLTGYVTNANHVYYGTKRLQFERSDTGNYYFFLGQGQYSPIIVPTNMEFRRVYHNTYDVLIAFPDGLEVGSGGRVANVDISNEYANPLKNFLDGWGATSLLQAIDESASFAILIALKVLPVVGIILMTILVGLAYMGQAEFFRKFCDTVIDPIRIITFNKRSIHTWEFRRVILPCVLLYIAFALFLNGNIIRVIVSLAEWYDVIVKWMRTW